jgi:hypothetical protein
MLSQLYSTPTLPFFWDDDLRPQRSTSKPDQCQQGRPCFPHGQVVSARFFFLFLTVCMLIPGIRLFCNTPPRLVDGDIHHTSLTFLFPPAAGCRA